MDLDHLFTHLRLLSLDGTPRGREVQNEMWIGVRQGRIAGVGEMAAHETLPAAERVTDLGDRLVTPALVDCHTHLVFAGDRAGEWARRLAGEDYASIAAAGGGILTTVAATRAASEEELTALCARRLRILAEDGVGTVEVKSGYGLDVASELRLLRAARAAGEEAGVRVVRTLLAAHAVPSEYSGRPDAYVDEVCVPLVHAAAAGGLAQAVDAFCESIAFTPAQVRRVFQAARAAGLPVKLHADQLTDSGGAALVAEFRGLSADHLEYASASGVEALAEAGATAVLLPGAFYGIGEIQIPPVARLREAGVPMAVATDANPGSSPLLSLRTAANLACNLFGLTAQEAWEGVTRHAAGALGLGEELGSVMVGMRADLAVWNAPSPWEIIHWIGTRPLHGRIREGEWQ